MKRLLKVFTKGDWKKKDTEILKDVPDVHKDIQEMLKKNAELLQTKGGNDNE